MRCTIVIEKPPTIYWAYALGLRGLRGCVATGTNRDEMVDGCTGRSASFTSRVCASTTGPARAPRRIATMVEVAACDGRPR